MCVMVRFLSTVQKLGNYFKNGYWLTCSLCVLQLNYNFILVLLSDNRNRKYVNENSFIMNLAVCDHRVKGN